MSKPAIHQIGSNLSFGDAISNDMLEIQASLTKLGFDSKIFAQYVDPRMTKHFNLFTEYKGDSKNIVLFHASIGGDLFDFVRKLPDKKILVYHNITPPDFFRGYNDHLVNLLGLGLEKMKEAVSYVDFAVGDSDFNRCDFVKMGFDDSKTDVLPIFVNFEKFEKPLNKKLQSHLKADGFKNIMFVGRFVPNKCQHDLIKVFSLYNRYFNPKSRLILIGNYVTFEQYYLRLKKLAKMLGVESNVIFADQVGFEDLATYYKSADLFMSMSEHEGFLVPVLESFSLNVPVLAYDAGAIAETMGNGGVVFKEKDFLSIAKTMDSILNDQNLRDEVIVRQHRRIKDFQRDRVEEKLMKVINRVLQ